MGRVFASSDWHGTGYLADKVFKFLKPDDTLYFLGDATDRNPDGIKIFQTLMTRPNTFYIMGNHDDFLIKAIEQINYDEDEIEGRPPIKNDPRFDITWWTDINGGEATYHDIWKLTKVERLKIYNFIKNMPLAEIYHSPKGHNVILEHAGYSPFQFTNRRHDPLWDREHFHDSWDGGWDPNEYGAKNTYLVHGHTPVQYLKFHFGYEGEQPLTKEERQYKKEFMEDVPTEYKPTILRYCAGHKFDIDMCTICSNRVALLDLDTFEEYYFDGKDE